MLNPTASIYRKVKSSYKNNNVSDFYDSWLFDVEFYGRWAGLSGSPFYHSGWGLLTECEKFLTLFDYHSERVWEIFVFRGAVIPNEHEESQSIVLSNAVGSSYIEFSWHRILYFVLFCSERQNEKEKTFGNSISWNDSTLWSVVWSSLLCLRFCCFPLHFGEVFARRLSRVLFETATEISGIVESRTIGDFGDIHFVITLHILERSCDTVRYDKIYRGAVE